MFSSSERGFKRALRDALTRAAWYELLSTMATCGKIVTFLCLGTGGVGHDSQSVPGDIFARAHFHLIAEGQTSPRAEGDVEIV